MSVNESSNQLQRYVFNRIRVSLWRASFKLLFLCLKDPRYERIIDVLPVKVELAGKKIKKIRKVNEMGLMLMTLRNFHLPISANT